MASAYLNKTTIERLKIALKDIESFYNANCLNWKGQTREGLYYTEVMAEHLLNLGIK